MIEVKRYRKPDGYATRFWAIYVDGELLAVTVYRKGAEAKDAGMGDSTSPWKYGRQALAPSLVETSAGPREIVHLTAKSNPSNDQDAWHFLDGHAHPSQ